MRVINGLLGSIIGFCLAYLGGVLAVGILQSLSPYTSPIVLEALSAVVFGAVIIFGVVAGYQRGGWSFLSGLLSYLGRRLRGTQNSGQSYASNEAEAHRLEQERQRHAQPVSSSSPHSTSRGGHNGIPGSGPHGGIP